MVATLADFTAAPATPLGFTLGSLDLSGSDARTDAGLATSRLLSDYSTRALPSLVNSEASKGTFYGGQAGVRADQLKEDEVNQAGDISRQLGRTLAGLRRQGVMAAAGVSL